MAVEIERKFLVISDAWRSGPPGVVMRQGYLASGRGVGATVRVRMVGTGTAARGWLTIKGPARRSRPGGAGGESASVRDEFEYEIPAPDAEHMLKTLCGGRIVEKVRFERTHGGGGNDGVVWEVDEFSGANAGLILAEVELDRPDQRIEIPAWVGREVTGDPRYANSTLSVRSFKAHQHE